MSSTYHAAAPPAKPRRRKRVSGRRFLRLWLNVKRSDAYHSLGAHARAALLEVLERYNGINNGMIVLGVRELADALNCSRDTASRALHELDDSGLVRPTKWGHWRGRRATEWRLMFYRCDKTGDLPVLNWPPRVVSPTSDTNNPTTVRSTASEVRPEGHNHNSRPSGRTQRGKSSINGSGASPTRGTHIDLHHRGGAASARDRAGTTPGSIPRVRLRRASVQSTGGRDAPDD